MSAIFFRPQCVKWTSLLVSLENHLINTDEYFLLKAANAYKFSRYTILLWPTRYGLVTYICVSELGHRYLR